MTIDLTARVKNFAIYMPSIQTSSASRIVSDNESLRDVGLPNNLHANDFNFLDPNNRYWHYKWCLATAGHFKDERKPNAITHRDPASCVLGDSGGYQIGQGTLGDTKHWGRYAKKPNKIAALWRSSDIRNDILRWLELNCDYAMTIDMPIWAIGLKKSPFYSLTAEQLTELTEDNLRFISDHRGKYGNCKFLNVLQGATIEQEQAWFDAVKQYEFEGWSLAGRVGTDGGIYRVLRRIIMLRDEKLLEPPYSWLHILKLSKVRWCPIVTSIQRGIRETTGNEEFTISYDSSSPYRVGGVAAKYAAIDHFDAAFKNWKISAHKIPTGYEFANMPKRMKLDRTYKNLLNVPLLSPIASTLTVQDLNPKKDRMATRTLDAFADEVLINHNVYIYCLATILANEAVYSAIPTAPKDMVAACDIVGAILKSEKPMSMLEKWKGTLGRVVGDKIKKP